MMDWRAQMGGRSASHPADGLILHPLANCCEIPMHNKRWTVAEDDELFSRIAAGEDLLAVARSLNRTGGAVHHRMQHLRRSRRATMNHPV